MRRLNHKTKWSLDEGPDYTDSSGKSPQLLQWKHFQRYRITFTTIRIMLKSLSCTTEYIHVMWRLTGYFYYIQMLMLLHCQAQLCLKKQNSSSEADKYIKQALKTGLNLWRIIDLMFILCTRQYFTQDSSVIYFHILLSQTISVFKSQCYKHTIPWRSCKSVLLLSLSIFTSLMS